MHVLHKIGRHDGADILPVYCYRDEYARACVCVCVCVFVSHIFLVVNEARYIVFSGSYGARYSGSYGAQYV